MKDAILKRYIGLSIEPIHVGSRQGRLEDGGRAFMTGTVRDNEGFPFIPASSLKGCVRALCSEDYGVETCDGKGWNCPQPHKCPSCSVFGYSNYHHGNTASSLVRFSSVDLLAIPVKTPKGILWISNWLRINRSGLIDRSSSSPKGWAFSEDLEASDVVALNAVLPNTKVPNEDSLECIDTTNWIGPLETREIYRNLVIIDQQTWSSLIPYSTGSASSVSIDSRSGRALNGALFETEHINRFSLLSIEVAYVNPVVRGIHEFINTKNSDIPHVTADLSNMIDIVEHGMKKIRIFGVGGKKSRGYGRIVFWPIPVSQEAQEIERLLPAEDLSVEPKVMISYSHKDKNVARRLATDLQQSKLDVKLDEKDMLVGESIHQWVEKTVSESDYVVVLLSPDSMQSPWVREEIDATRMREKERDRIILLTAMLKGVSSSKFPTLLKDRKSASLWPKYEDGFQYILRSIREYEQRKRIKNA